MAESQCNKYKGDNVKVILVLGEGHMARQYTQPKRLRNATWYKEKAMLAEAQKAGQILDEEQLAFLVDLGVLDGQVVQNNSIPTMLLFRLRILILMILTVMISRMHKWFSWLKHIPFVLTIISEVPHSETYLNDMLNRQTEDFGKRFAPQQELSAKQASWLRMFDPTSKPSDALPVKIEAPNELLKISLVNEGLKKHKFHLAKFDNVVKIRTTPNLPLQKDENGGFENILSAVV
ncbi:hypothetical protein Tco_0568612 [Tanacetum coccineum]